MKKALLILSAAAVLPLAGSAQTLTMADMSLMKQERPQAERAAVSKDMPQDNSLMLNANRRAPRRVVSDGVWYTRPEGSLLISSPHSSSSKYSYLVVPPYVDQKFVNRAEEKEGSYWMIGENEYQADENGDFTNQFNIPPSGYVDLLPTLYTEAGDDFVYGSEIANADNYCLPVDTIYSLTNVNRNGGYYSGFSNGYVFGTNESVYKVSKDSEETAPCYCDYITEFFGKPARTFYLTDIWFHYNSNISRAIPEGTDMKLQILRVLEDGSLDLDDPIATMSFNMNDTLWSETGTDGGSYGCIMVSQKEVNVFGTEEQIPVYISDEFAVRISGFHQPGVDFGLYMGQVYYPGDQNVTEDAYEFGGPVYPTIYSYVNDAGEVVGDNWQYRQGERQFNAVMFLDGMWDVAEIADEGFKTLVAPAEGGYAATTKEYELTNGTTSTLNYIEVYTTLPWESTWEESVGEDNYFLVLETEDEDEEWPEWLSPGIDSRYFEEYGSYILFFEAAALPEDVTGRYAQIRLVSDKGAESEVITIIQGDVEVESINSTKADSRAANAATYSLDGRAVGKAFKGIVVKDGKKVFVK